MLTFRYVFIGGLHRSGTSLTAGLIGANPDVAAVRDAPVPENEGVYLQGAIPHTARHGRPMHFATDPAQHHVEGSRYDTAATRDRIAADWAPWFGDGPWRVEKSPVNLTRGRLYQQLFPLSQFVFVLRHPEAVAAAVAKWVDAPAGTLIDHWLDAHERMEADRAYLHAHALVRYEDLTADPEAVVGSLTAFLTLDPHAVGPLRDGNLDYVGAPRMTTAQAKRAARWGYGPGLSVAERAPDIVHPLRSVAEAARSYGPKFLSSSGTS